LSLYHCTGLSRHALSYLRLCPLLHTVDLSRIHSLDDGSIAEWVLPTPQLQAQQPDAEHMRQTMQQHPLQQQRPSALAAAAVPPPLEPNLNLPAIFAAQAQFSAAAGAGSGHGGGGSHSSSGTASTLLRQHATTQLRSVSLDSCTRVSALGLQVLLESCPALTFCNAFGVANLTRTGLQALLRAAVQRKDPLRTLQVGGSNELHSSSMDDIRREFRHIHL